MTEHSTLAGAVADRYELQRELGAGGMATVYLARDVRHDRQVAIKVLRPELAAIIGAERFLAEIKTTANLQHPHILSLHDSGTVDGTVFYVMPFVAGESLRDRLRRDAQLPVVDALRIATEVAGALDYAHRQGVIHRDIKPENILLHEGQALVADFGIALAASRTEGGTRMTETGMSLGTPHYMSPEQAMGERTLDARTDVYALGCVLYEMLTGEPPYTGPTAQAIVAKVLSGAPQPVQALRKAVPVHVAATIEQSIEKLPADRFESAAAFARALADPGATAMRSRAAMPVRHPRWRIAAAAGAVIALAGAAFVAGRGASDAQRSAGAATAGVVRASLMLGDSLRVRAINNQRLAVSPDGRRLVFVGSDGGEDHLWVRELDDDQTRLLADTRGAFAPFFSPDGGTIGFFSSASGTSTMRVVPFAGGSARTVLADSVTQFGGADWGDDGQIYFTLSHRSLARVSPDGGAITRITRIDSTSAIKEHDYPDVLPGSRHAVVMLWRGSIAANRIGLVELATGEVTELGPGSYARHVAPGRLLIGGAGGRVTVASLDVDARRITGTAEVLLPPVQWDGANGTVQFAVTPGALAYLPEVGASGALVWVDRTGRQTPAGTGLEAVAATLSLSPDGRRAVYMRTIEGDNTVWVRDLQDGTSSRMSFDVSGPNRPVWTPDGQRVAYVATDANGRLLAWTRRADGTDSVRRAVPGDVPVDEIQFDPRGRYTVLRTEGSSPGTRRLLLAEAGSSAAPRVLLGSRDDHYGMTLSPDGNWIAYVSTEAGWPEVYVRPFPNVDSARVIISSGGGTEPLWSRDGKELFYRDRRGAMYAVPVTTGPRFTRGNSVLLFAAGGLATDEYHRSYDVHPDGTRFLMVTSAAADASAIALVLDWESLLARTRPPQ